MQSKTRKLTAAAMLCALAYVAVAFGRIPVLLFLSYEPKDVIIALGGLIWGPLTALAVSVVVSIIEMLTISGTGVLGCIMNILSSCAFACTAAFIYRKKRTLTGAVIGLASGVVVMVVVMMVWNYLITPIYMEVSRETVLGLLIPAFLPFNLLKGGLNAALTFLLYKPVVSILRRTGWLDAAAAQRPKRHIGMILLAVLVVVTCVLFILSLNGVF